MKYTKVIISMALMLFSLQFAGATAFENSGMYTEEGQMWLNEHWGENITIGDVARIAYTRENYEKTRGNVDPAILEEIWSQPYYWGSRQPWGTDNSLECPYGANVWEESRPLNIKNLNLSQKQEMGIENAVLDKSGCRIVGYMDQSVEQGGQRSFHRQMPERFDRFTFDLFWQDRQNSLKLTIFAPDGMMGPYYDDSDGILNGRIYLQVSRPEGIAPGDWYAVVEGDKVNGTQHFMLLVV